MVARERCLYGRKLDKAFEEGVGAAWATGNAARMASAQVSQMQETPTLIGLLRRAREPEVRRGLTFPQGAANGRSRWVVAVWWRGSSARQRSLYRA